MKKMLYSNYMKVIAVILFIISIVSGALIVIDGIATYSNEKEYVYGFESDFSEARFFSNLLIAPESAIFSAYHSIYYRVDENEETDIQNNAITVEGRTIENRIEEKLNDLYCLDKINYYVNWNGKVFTNCGATSEKDLMQAQFYRYTSRDENGNIERELSQSYYLYSMLEETLQFDKTGTITVCTSIKDSYVEKCKAVWERQAAIVNDTFTETLVFVAFALLLLVYLICVCGKNKDGEYKTMWLDNIWTEVHLAAIGGIGIGVVAICVILLDEYFTGHFPYNMMNMIVGLSAAIASTVVLTALLSIIRNIKCKRFVASSIIIRIIRWIWRTFVAVIKWFYRKAKSFKNVIVGALSQKTGAILISMLFAYTAIIALCCLLTFVNFIIFALWILIGFFVFGFACFVVSYRAKDLDEIRKGAKEIRKGNLTYKIPEPKSEDMKLFANDINDIARGLDESVSAKLKAERMKTELITNVSHDLKTPLTSIISYTELLSKVEGLPGEAKDYIRIISTKSNRLKNLTQDLFDISKAQSGNENVVFEKLDAALLINQSLGENDNEIKKSGLMFCVNAQKELYISADGRKMSRAISNLINNILKYTMKNTRVFISAFEQDDEIIIELKNIASYPMDFKVEEIVGRFVRGDESRTTEGNGLGLAIAKSYTEICNGKFGIVIDGDMFKVIIKFRKYN